MAKQNDTVFQLSLTEIAFTLVFLLMLLLGWMLFIADKRNSEQKDIQAQTAILKNAKATLAQELRAAGAKPDDVITKLVSQTALLQERDALKQRIKDLEAQVTALAAIKKAAESAGKSLDESARDEINAALALKSKLEEQIRKQAPTGQSDEERQETAAASKTDVETEALAGLALKGEIEKQLRAQMQEPYPVGKEKLLAKEMVAGVKQLRDSVAKANSPEAMRKENADLKGRVAFLQGKLNKLNARGGIDYPPCWAEESTGKIEYLFNIELRPDGLLISRGWPDKRNVEALALPNIDKLISSKPHLLPEFNELMKGIDALSRAKECRHFVIMKNRVNDLKLFNGYRFGIESFFYKYESRE